MLIHGNWPPCELWVYVKVICSTVIKITKQKILFALRVRCENNDSLSNRKVWGKRENRIFEELKVNHHQPICSPQKESFRNEKRQKVSCKKQIIGSLSLLGFDRRPVLGNGKISWRKKSIRSECEECTYWGWPSLACETAVCTQDHSRHSKSTQSSSPKLVSHSDGSANTETWSHTWYILWPRVTKLPIKTEKVPTKSPCEQKLEKWRGVEGHRKCRVLKFVGYSKG